MTPRSATASAPLLGHASQGPERPGTEVVLLLNGGMMSYPAWEPIAEPLSTAGRCRVVACDFRGQLLSPGRPPETLHGHVDDVLRMLDAVDLSSVHVLGTSFGAAVGLLLAGRSPERVRSLALVTATDRVTPAMREDVAALRRAAAEVASGGDPGRFHEQVQSTVYSADYLRRAGDLSAEARRRLERMPRAWFEGLDGLLAAFGRPDLNADLRAALDPASRVPSLVALAADDRVIPPERSRALASALGADLVEHPTSGHALVVEDPEWVVTVYRAFLRRLGGDGSAPEGSP